MQPIGTMERKSECRGYNAFMLPILNDRQALTDLIKREARALGFDLVGIAPAGPSARADAYRDWLAAGKQGEMAYLAGGVEERLDVTRKLQWAKSVVCVAVAYFQKPEAGSPKPEGGKRDGKIARYAWGRDYHRVLGKKLQRLEKRVRGLVAGPIEARTYADTGPILEREFAALAGLGWIGKHTLLIHPRHGSYFLLGEMVTSLDLAADASIKDHCGTCTRCIDACPTGAITPYSVDARRCISYLTLEHRAAIAAEFKPAMREAGYLIGCDICQEVCPHNRDPLGLTERDFAVQSPAPAIDPEVVLGWDEQGWDIATRGHAHRRARHEMWRRNAGILLAADDVGAKNAKLGRDQSTAEAQPRTMNHEGLKL